MKILYIVRHPETVGNVKKLVQGSFDEYDACSITDKGIDQCGATSKKIASLIKDSGSLKHTFIYSSPQFRTTVMADCLSYALDDIIPIFDDRLRGRCYGKLEGRKITDVALNPALLVALTFFPKSALGAESSSMADSRYLSFMNDIGKKHNNSSDSVIIVCNSDFIKFFNNDIVMQNDYIVAPHSSTKCGDFISASPNTFLRVVDGCSFPSNWQV